MKEAAPVTQDRWLAKGGSYEYRTLRLARGVPVADTRRYLADEAERGRWELTRTRIYRGGAREVTLRRKAIHVEPTLYTA
jgi:hypothetical protein